MIAERPLRVLGVDGMKGGWVGVLLETGNRPQGFSAPTIAGLADHAGAVDVVCVDIPIGLGATDERSADRLARRELGSLKSTLFPTPVREALLATTYTEACEINVRVTGKSITKQTYALRTKIFEVEQWVRDTELDVREVHPEVSFALLRGMSSGHSKATWAGMHERAEALLTAGIDLRHLRTEFGKASVDDVIDAAVAAWTATRIAAGTAVSFPSPPEVIDGWDRPAAIWA